MNVYECKSTEWSKKRLIEKGDNMSRNGGDSWDEGDSLRWGWENGKAGKEYNYQCALSLFIHQQILTTQQCPPDP